MSKRGRRRFPVLRFMLVLGFLGGALYYYLLWPEETVFSNRVLSRFAPREGGELDAPERPISHEQIVQIVAEQLKKAHLGNTTVASTDARMSSDIQIFAAFAAQVVLEADNAALTGSLLPEPEAVQKNEVRPADALATLEKDLYTMQSTAAVWEMSAAAGQDQKASAHNIARWAALLTTNIIANWKEVRRTAALQSVSSQNLFIDSLGNIIGDQKGFRRVFQLDLGSSMRKTAQDWVTLAEEEEEFDKAVTEANPPELNRLLAIQRDKSNPRTLRAYALAIYEKRVPFPLSQKALEIELSQLHGLAGDFADLGFPEVLTSRIKLLEAASAFVQDYIKHSPDIATSWATLQRDAATTYGAGELVGKVELFTRAVRAAESTEASMQNFDGAALQRCTTGWTEAKNKGAFFEELAGFAQGHLEPYQELAAFGEIAPGELIDPAKRWQGLQNLRRRHFEASSDTWRKLYNFMRRSSFPWNGDVPAVQAEIAKYADLDDRAWGESLAAYAQLRDSLPGRFPNFESLRQLQAAIGVSSDWDRLESDDVISFLKSLDELGAAANKVSQVEESAARAMVNLKSPRSYELAAADIAPSLQELRRIAETPALRSWTEMVDRYIETWQRALGLNRRSDATPERDIQAALVARDFILAEFIASVRASTADLPGEAALYEFIDRQKQHAVSCGALAQKFNRPFFDEVASFHMQIAEAAASYRLTIEYAKHLADGIQGEVLSSGRYAMNASRWPGVDFAWWKQRRPDSEAAIFVSDTVIIKEYKLLPSPWEKNIERGEGWVNRALPNTNFDDLAASARSLEGRMKSKAGKEIAAKLTGELDAFQAANEQELYGKWAMAQQAFEHISPQTIRGAVLREARLVRLSQLTQEKKYVLPKNQVLTVDSEPMVAGNMKRWAANIMHWNQGLFIAIPVVAVINQAMENQQQMRLQNVRLVAANDGLVVRRYQFLVIEPLEIHWRGGDPVSLSFFPINSLFGKALSPGVATEKPIPAPLVSATFEGSDALFQFAKKTGLSAELLGFRYRVPDKTVEGKVAPRDWRANKPGMEAETKRVLHSVQDLSSELLK